MRLVAHRQDEEKDRPTSPDAEATDNSMHKASPTSIGSPKRNNMTEAKFSPPVSTSSPRKLDRQGSIEGNQSSTASESVSTQVHLPKRLALERGDTMPSESTPLSSSSTLPSSPKLVTDVVNRSVVVDPPSTFADEPKPQKDIYFPYLSKVRGIERDGSGGAGGGGGGGQEEALYQPLRFDKPTREPFSLPSKPQELRVSIETTSDPFAFSPGNISIVGASPEPKDHLVKAPTREYKSSLLLRHGYTPYRDCTVDSLMNRMNRLDEPDSGGVKPIIVREGCAPPVAEPIIVAEYFVPLCEVK